MRANSACRLKVRSTGRISQTMESVGSRQGKAQQERTAACRGHASRFGFADDFRTVSIGHDKARLEGHQVDWCML